MLAENKQRFLLLPQSFEKIAVVWALPALISSTALLKKVLIYSEFL
ncbi:hypothetical protein [Acinetobacter sp. A47]|nr:hypothetical protein [Acinetobacter sp. A47]